MVHDHHLARETCLLPFRNFVEKSCLSAYFQSFLSTMYCNCYDCTGKIMVLFSVSRRTRYLFNRNPSISMQHSKYQHRKGTMQSYSCCCHGRQIPATPSYELSKANTMSWFTNTMAKLQTAMLSCRCFKIRKHSKNVMCYTAPVHCNAYSSMLCCMSCCRFLQNIQTIWIRGSIAARCCSNWHAEKKNMRWLCGYREFYASAKLRLFSPLRLPTETYSCILWATQLFLRKCTPVDRTPSFYYIISCETFRYRGFCPLYCKPYNMVEAKRYPYLWLQNISIYIFCNTSKPGKA
uniref:p505_3R n=1 Tax=African swine fever virus TaxID=10497 RepID=A0A6G7KU77_ASF